MRPRGHTTQGARGEIFRGDIQAVTICKKYAIYVRVYNVHNYANYAPGTLLMVELDRLRLRLTVTAAAAAAASADGRLDTS